MTPRDRDNAEHLLKVLLPKAREQAKEQEELKFRTVIAKAQRAYLIESNVGGVHVYHANTGGWIADIYLKDTPIGVANVIGTPVANPCKTRDEALEQAVMMLASIISNTAKQHEKVQPTFQLYDIALTLDGSMLEFVAKTQLETEGTVGYENPDKAVQKLEAILKQFFGNAEPSYDILMTLELEAKARLMAVCTMCALTGILRYPPPEPKVVED